MPEQNRAGSAKFSPSGTLVAYGVGRGNPDSEFGQVVVAPADGSGDQTIVAAMEGGYYQVLGWIDESSLLLILQSTEVPERLEGQYRRQRTGQVG